jgi:uroporphyrinogen decarboxylase
MTSRERVQAALSHRQPDRVPLDYYARTEITNALMERLGLRSGEELLQALGVDLRGVGPAFKHPAATRGYADPTVRVGPDETHYDIWGVGYRPNQTAAGFYMDLAHSPLRGLRSVEELDDYPWPSADLWDYSGIRNQATAQADYWTWGHSRGIFEVSWFVRGFDEFMTDLAANPERAEALMDRVQAYLMERTRRILDAGGGAIDMIE